MERKYVFAKVRILISTDFDFSDSERYVPFRAEFEKPDITYNFIMVDTLEQPDAEPVYYDGFIRVFRNGGTTFRYFPIGGRLCAMLSDESIANGVFTVYIQRPESGAAVTELRLFDYIAIEHLMAMYGGALLHSSFIDYEGKAILFTAPSQTGKSTQAELWRVHRGAEVINGDRSLLKLDGDTVSAFSLPYCGTSGICKNHSAPLRAVVVLRQAPYNRISVLRPADAFRFMYEECAINIWHSSDVVSICDIIEKVINTVPVYMLECLPDRDAVETLARALEL